MSHTILKPRMKNTVRLSMKLTVSCAGQENPASVTASWTGLTSLTQVAFLAQWWHVISKSPIMRSLSFNGLDDAEKTLPGL